MERKQMIRGVICTLLGGTCWGFSGSCGQYLFNRFQIDPTWLTVVRMLSAGVILSVYTILRQRERVIACWQNRRDRLNLAAYGIFGLLFCQFTYLQAINATNAGTATVLQYIGPVLIMILVCFQKKRPPTLREAVSIVLVVVGTFLIATHGDPHSMKISGIGLFWGLLSAVALVAYTLLPRQLTPVYGSLLVTGFGALIGGVVSLVLAHPWPLFIPLTAAEFLAICGMVLVGTICAFPLYMQGVSDVGPVKASMLASIEPVAATVLSVVWLGSDFGIMDLVGFVCIIATVFLLAKAEETEPEASTEEHQDPVELYHIK